MVKSANRIWRIVAALALIGTLLATGTATAGAQDAGAPSCSSTFSELSFQDFPPTKRVMVRSGTQVSSRWVTTIQGSPTGWTKPNPALTDDFIVRVVPADGSARFDVDCVRPAVDAELPPALVGQLPFTGPACTVVLGGNGPDNVDLRFFGTRGTRPQLRSVQNGWVTGIDDSYRANIDSSTIRTARNTVPVVAGQPVVFNQGETKVNVKFGPTDDFLIRVRQGGVRSDIACEVPPTAERFFASPELAPPIPGNVSPDQANFSVQFAGDLDLVEILDKTTGQLTILDVTDDYKNPRISPDGSVLWMLDQETQEELRIDLNSRLVTRRPR